MAFAQPNPGTSKDAKNMPGSNLGTGADFKSPAELEALEAARKAQEAADAARMAAGLDGKKGRVAAGTGVKIDQLKTAEGLPVAASTAAEVPEPTKIDLEVPTEARLEPKDKADFIAKADSPALLNQIDEIALHINREHTKINSQDWNSKVTNEAGLKEVYNQFYELGILDSDPPFYKRMFAILENGITKNPYLADSQHKAKFLNPANSYREISTLGPRGDFFGGELYMKAFIHLQYVQGMVLNQDKGQIDTAAKQGDKNKDGIAHGITDFVKDNLNTFKKAIRDKDYATAGLYAVGIWAIYKSYQKLELSGGKAEKWLIYGAAAYAGHTFLQNAGYDILKMTGFRDADYDVKGTPMEVMKNILASNPKLSEETKDMDYGVVLDMADVNLKSLNELYKESNKSGVQFIPPEQFPGVFPDEIIRSRPSKTGLESNLKDDKGMNSVKLNSSQADYVKLGQQIYKVALAMRGCYGETLMKDRKQKNYFGIPYEDALNSGNHSLGKVRHLVGSLQSYTQRFAAEGFVGKELIEKARKDLGEVFKGKADIGLHLEDKIADGQFEGRLMGMPMIFVVSEDGKSYKAFLKNEYGSKALPGNDFELIPLEAGSSRDVAVDKVIARVTARMKVLLGPIAVNGGSYSVPRYERGAWVADVTLPAAPRFDVDVTPLQVKIEVNKNGKGINIVDSTGNVRINLDEEVGKQYPLGISLAPRITSQPEFHALKVFANAGEFKVVSVNEAAGTVKVNLGKNDMPIEFTYDKATKKFSVSAAAEEALVKNPAFSKEFVDSLKGDENFELNKTLKDFKKLIEESCDQKFVSYFFKSLVGATKKDPLDGVNLDVFSGSVPSGFANMIIDSSNAEVMERLRYSVGQAKTMAEVEDARVRVLQDFNTRMKTILTDLKAENADLKRKGENWDRDKFMDLVVGRVRTASSISDHYVQSKADFEYMVYGLDLPGLFTQGSDIGGEASHSAVSDMMGVYAYHTAYLDNPEFTYKINGVNTKVKIDLDHLTYPPVPTAGITDTKLDPAFEGHYITQYMEYVKDEIYSKASGQNDLSNLPLASATGFWGIKDYKQWKETEGKYEPLNTLDSKALYTHDETLHIKDPAEFTELDEALEAELMKAVNLLKREYGDILDYAAIEDYLSNETYIKGKRPLGLLVPFDVDVNGVPERKCALWDITKRIASAGASSGKRSTQVKLMEVEVNKFVRMIFEEPGIGRDKRFFTESPSWSTQLVMKWPWLRHILPNN